MQTPKIIFKLKGEEVVSITAFHSFPGEVAATKELIAYEKGVNEDEIEVVYKSGVKP